MVLTRAIPFSTTPNFEYLQTIMSKNVNSPLTFTKDTTGAVLGYSCLVKLLADGINLPDLLHLSYTGMKLACDNFLKSI